MSQEREDEIEELCAWMSKHTLLTGRQRMRQGGILEAVVVPQVEYWALVWGWDPGPVLKRWWAAITGKNCGSWAWQKKWRDASPVDLARLSWGESYPNPPPSSFNTRL